MVTSPWTQGSCPSWPLATIEVKVRTKAKPQKLGQGIQDGVVGTVTVTVLAGEEGWSSRTSTVMSTSSKCSIWRVGQQMHQAGLDKHFKSAMLAGGGGCCCSCPFLMTRGGSSFSHLTVQISVGRLLGFVVDIGVVEWMIVIGVNDVPCDGTGGLDLQAVTVQGDILGQADALPDCMKLVGLCKLTLGFLCSSVSPVIGHHLCLELMPMVGDEAPEFLCNEEQLVSVNTTTDAHWRLLTNKTTNVHWWLLTNKITDVHWGC